MLTTRLRLPVKLWHELSGRSANLHNEQESGDGSWNKLSMLVEVGAAGCSLSENYK